MKIEFLHNNAPNMLESRNQSKIRWFFCSRPSQPKSNADADFVCFIVGVQGNITRLRGGMTDAATQRVGGLDFHHNKNNGRIIPTVVFVGAEGVAG